MVAEHVDAWAQSFEDDEYKASTIHRKLSLAKSFFSWLVARGDIDLSPADGVEMPQRTYDDAPTLSQAEVRRLFDACRGKSQDHVRARALLDVIYSTGATVHEVTSLTPRDVDIAAGTIRLGSRVAPLGKAKASLRAWLALRDTLRTGGMLFCNFRGTGGLTDRSVQRILADEVGHRAGVEGVTPMVLRHSCARHMIEGGATLQAVQELLGHDRLTSTQRMYASYSPVRLKQVHRATHPRG